MDLKALQAELKRLDLYHLDVDGEHGPKTDDAIEALFLKERVAGFESWGDLRREIAAEQIVCKLAGIDAGAIDGRVGTMTRHAFEVYDARQKNGGKPVPEVETWRDDPKNTPPVEPSHPLPILKPADHPDWPRQSGVPAFYGAVGTRQATLTLPFPMRIAWEMDKSVRSFSCHERCKPHFERIWVRTLDHYGIDEVKRLRLDLYGGCLNVRKMRGGSAWSMHSWGIAEDVDPDHNQLKFKRAQATLDDAPYDPFWSFVYAEGAIGLGRERDYDWMHFQFAKL